MRKYLVKRLLLSVVILFFVTFIIYLLMRCMPSSYVENMARQLSQAPGSKPYEEWLAQLNAQYGLDLGSSPAFSSSSRTCAPATSATAGSIPCPSSRSSTRSSGSRSSWALSRSCSSFSSRCRSASWPPPTQYSVTDYTVTTVALLGMSLPTFFFATLLKLIFCIKLGWFDLVGLTGRDFNSLSQFGRSSIWQSIWCCPS